MKITRIRAIPVNSGMGTRNYLIVKVETDEGIYGLGEAGITGKELAVAGAIQHFDEQLRGEDPSRIEHIWQRLFRGNFFKGGQILTAAISAVDLALWDIKGKALGRPVWDLLGGKCREKVVCYAHIIGESPEELAIDAVSKVRDGFRFVRLGIPEEPGGILEPRRAVPQTVEMLAAVREAVGNDIEICVDFHTRFDPIDAVRLCDAVEPYDLFFAEDPVRSENPDAYAFVRRHTNVPIAGGEELATKWEFKPLIERDLIDYVRVDLCIVGGLTEATKIAGWAEAHYQKLAPHNPLGPVSTAACAHLDFASPLFGVQELSREPGYLADLFPQQPPFEDGYLLLPERPGLGVDINEEAVADHPFQMPSTHELRMDDRSVTNW